MADWSWPQIILASLMGFSCILAPFVHGRPRDPHDAALTWLANGFMALLLGWGGFWK